MNVPDVSHGAATAQDHLAAAGAPPDCIEIQGCRPVDQDGDDTILRAALRAGIGLPYECNSGGCGSCKFELLSGSVDNLWPDAPGLSARDRQRNRHLACQSRACGVVAIKVRTGTEYVPHVKPRRMKARLVKRQALTHDLHEFSFHADGDALFRPGQYAMLQLPGVDAPRAYSMCNLPNAGAEWAFQIRRVPGGKGTARLFDALPTGSEVEIDGPYGLAWLREDAPRDIVCIAGGSGLAPMISIARGAAAAGMLGSRKLHFFYGARTAADVCGEPLLAELPEYGRNLHYTAVVSADPEGWHGERGFVHEGVERLLGGELASKEFFFAGPPPMAQAVQDMLMVKHRVPFGQIHFDRFF